MPLKLRAGTGDMIVLSDGVQIMIKSTSERVVGLEITAPPEIRVHTIFKDPKKQFKNLRKAETTDKGQHLTPEEQREMALRRINRRDPL